MLERTDGADLVDEARHRRRSLYVGAEPLDGHLATDVLIDRRDDLPDPALAERPAASRSAVGTR